MKHLASFLKCFFVSISVIVIFLAAGCKEPENVGLDVLPENDLTGLNTTDTISLLTSTVKEDSVLASNTTLNLLGDINDEFGNAKASFYTQALLETPNADFGANASCDSIVLSLDYAGYYGDTNSTHNFTVYQLNESIETDSLYFSDKIFSTSTTLGTQTIAGIKPNESLVINGITTNPHLRITLNNSFGDTLLGAGTGPFVDNTSFLNYFKGIYVHDLVAAGNTGSIMYFGLTEAMSKITLYYHSDNGDSLDYEFLLNGTGKVNHFEHDFSNAVFGNNFNDYDFGKNLCYVQSMAGVKTKIDFPFLNSLVQDGQIAINNAKLIISADNSNTTLFPLHSKLVLTGIDSSGISVFLPDFLDNSVPFGGDVTSSNTYTFTISRFFQQILSGSRTNYGLFLVANGSAVNAGQTVIGGSEHPALKMKLQLISTKPQ
ncbi:MAG: DUF4270 domain-containing protein [Bacteroidia bacterium]